MQDLYQTDLDGGDGETGLHPVALTNWQDFYKHIYLERLANPKKSANKKIKIFWKRLLWDNSVSCFFGPWLNTKDSFFFVKFFLGLVQIFR